MTGTETLFPAPGKRKPTPGEMALYHAILNAWALSQQERFHEAQDAIADAIDFIEGWCSPRLKVMQDVDWSELRSQRQERSESGV